MLSLGIDIGGTKTVLGAVDEHGHIVQQKTVPSRDALESAPTPAQALTNTIRAFSAEQGVPLSALSGVGVGIPGVINRAKDIIANCPNLSVLDSQPLGRDVTALLGVPTFVENDVNLIALGEYLHGNGQGTNNLAAVYVGSGVGGGLIFDGKLFDGNDGGAPEIGHTIVEPDGLPCTCGGIGCLEMYCSGKALAIQAPRLLGVPEADAHTWSTARLVLDAARNGHADSLAAVQRAFYYLAVGVTNLINIVNPGVVLLGGGIIDAWPEGVDSVREMVMRRARIVIRDRVEFRRGSLGNDAGLIGAAMVVQQRLRGQ